MPSPRSNLSPARIANREIPIIAVLTVAGLVLRLCRPGRLGLIHFDEGIYAIAGLWSVSPRSLAGLDPMVIPYAPAGYPVLVGLAYLGLGVSDVAAILVSILAGTITIAAAAWLARRTFGAGAGAAGAALVAFSGAHVAFSRMALTDASFLLCWVIGLICGQRFLERPGPGRAIGLGLSVGLAQYFKYNGWLIGAIVVLAALIGMGVDASERERLRLRATWGYGLLAALCAWLTYWPWFGFVESHGGYAGLLRHQRSYLGGAGSWPVHLRLQLEQMSALSGGPIWNTVGPLGAFTAGALSVLAGKPIRHYRGLVAAAVVPLVSVIIPFAYSLMGPTLIFDDRVRRSNAVRLLASAWLVMSILTPFYHPYARLWLPLQLLGWVTVAGYIRAAFVAVHAEPDTRSDGTEPVSSRRSHAGPWIAGILFVGAIEFLGTDLFRRPTIGPGGLPGPLAPADSLRNAVKQALSDLPSETRGLRLLVRPPVVFYLGGRIPSRTEPNLARLLEFTDRQTWALIDVAQLRQEGDLKTARSRLLSRWEIVHEYPTFLNLPTLLDVDPGAARAGDSELIAEPLWLLRPRMVGANP
jgi:dolichyl-phosphate-mannose-protein mannosyltransferase